MSRAFLKTLLTVLLLLHITDAQAIAPVSPAKPSPKDSVQMTKYIYPGAAKCWSEEFSYDGIPFLAAGVLIRSEKKEWQNVRNSVAGDFNTEYDDFVQYSPIGITALLKLCGVKTRSNWWRFITSTGMSAATTAAIAHSLKYSVREMRPDGTENTSFPSGHTSMAFMAATVMHKELGARSPWYSIGAYTIATATGFTRLLNNRHWISDIVFGAGVGITSVNLGYFITDLIFKERGIDARYTGFDKRTDLTENPSFASIGMEIGAATPFKAPQFDSAQQLELKFKPGLATAITAEGAYFFNSYIGIGAQARATVASLEATFSGGNTLQANGLTYKLQSIDPTSFGTIDTNIGPYASLPINRRLRIECKAMAGYRLVGKYDFSGTYTLDANSKAALIKERLENKISQQEYKEQSARFTHNTFLKAATAHSMNMSIGAGITFIPLKNSVARAYVDYTYSAPNISYTLNSDESTDVHTPMHNFNFGLSICTTF